MRVAYPTERVDFGPTYVIPKPFDPRVLIHESLAVAKAAMESGVARQPVDPDQYRRALEARLEEIASR